MFRKNNVSNEQLNLFSKSNGWSEYKLKRMEQSWAGYFHDTIMPAIDEEPYKVLYSSDNASRPNKEVNILIGLFILKPLANLTDEELLDSVMFDDRFRYALHLLDSDKNVSKNMLGDFRRKLENYRNETGIDLFDNTMRELNNKILELNNVDRNIERIDSLMISASCKRMSRIELSYTVIENFIKYLSGINKVQDEFKRYLEDGNKNEVIYRTKDTESSDKLTTLLSDAVKLYDNFKDDEEVNQSKEFKLLERLIDDQYDKNNNKPKDGKEIKPTSLQNPSDPEATYRYKYKDNIGYVGNIVEATNNGNPMITDWDVAQNIKSDTEFMQEYINKIENDNETSDICKRD